MRALENSEDYWYESLKFRNSKKIYQSADRNSNINLWSNPIKLGMEELSPGLSTNKKVFS